MTVADTQVRETADRAALTELVHRYAVAVDRMDNEMYRSCFLPDAEFEMEGVVKRGDEFLDAGRRRGPGETRRIAGIDAIERSTHAMSDVLISLDGDRAHVESVVVAYLIGPRDGERAMVVRGVRYIDDAVRVDAGWKIARRNHQFMWMFEAQPTEVAPGH
jgi:hypothetical protein